MVGFTDALKQQLRGLALAHGVGSLMIAIGDVLGRPVAVLEGDWSGPSRLRLTDAGRARGEPGGRRGSGDQRPGIPQDVAPVDDGEGHGSGPPARTA